MNLFYNNFKRYWVKAEIVCRREGILKVSPALASPIKILIVHIQEQIQRRPILSPNRHNQCMDNKIYS